MLIASCVIGVRVHRYSAAIWARKLEGGWKAVREAI
jgi:hypothetical protein